MFSGIVEKTSIVKDIQSKGSNKKFTFINVFPNELYIDQSISHNGVCLTVIDFNDDMYVVEAIKETLDITNLGNLKIGDEVNLERSVLTSTRMDGHMVQGHIDGVAKIKEIQVEEGSWEITLQIPEDRTELVIPKGSIALNGISLTLKAVEQNIIKVAIIPFTYQMTNIKYWEVGQMINVEYDVMGKYILAYLKKIMPEKQ